MSLLTPTSIRELLAAHGGSASRALGQHFLADPNTVRRIVRVAEVEAGDRVLEIGPGVGSLTLGLLEAGARVTAVELDRHVLPVLADAITRAVGADGTDTLTVVEGDALTFDLASLVEPPTSLVANLPYNVSTPLLLRVLDDVPAVTRALVMVQREVGERLAAPPGSRVYGYPSLRVAYYARARVVGLVPPTVFLPPPKVESALVELIRHPEPPVAAAPERIFELARAGFAQRRKTLRRALAPVLGARTEATLAAANVDPYARAEVLSLADWNAIAEARS